MTKIRVIAIILLLSFSLSVPASAIDIAAKGGCSMDYETGTLLFEKNANTPLVPASMTKVMTLYLVFEQINAGNLSKDTIVTVSQNAANEAARAGYTNIPLKAGEKVSVDTLIKGITTVSACGACTAIAEHISGTEANFVKLMNQKASELGLTASFSDSSGISNYNQITPASLASLVRQFIMNYPDILNYTSKPSVTIKGKTYSSTNQLIRSGSSYYYKGADGFKTGTTNRAGCCIVSTASRDGRRIISVVMNAPSNAGRYTDSIKILNDGFSRTDFKNTYLYTTDIKAYVDGYEIPCCYYMGKTNTLCVIAENLNSFGFDTQYDNSTSTLYIYDNPTKEIDTMVPGDLPPMTPMYQIHSETKINVVLVTQDGQQHTLKNVYALKGMCAISFDELGKYFSYSWNGDTRCANLVA